MKKIIVFGTFDVFHRGHSYFLKEAKKQGDYLIVVIARDKTVKKLKKEKPWNDEKERFNLVKNSLLADEVVLGNLKDKYKIIKEKKPDIIVLGYDQKFFVNKLQKKLKEFKLLKTKIIRLKSFFPQKYKSSIIKKSKLKLKQK